MTQTGKMTEALERIKALAAKRRDKVARAKTHTQGHARTEVDELVADGLDIAAGVIADVLAH